MSESRWCDYGDHAFSVLRGSTEITPKKSIINQWGQREWIESDPREMCNECAAAAGFITDYTAPEAPSVRKSRMVKELKNGDSTG